MVRKSPKRGCKLWACGLLRQLRVLFLPAVLVLPPVSYVSQPMRHWPNNHPASGNKEAPKNRACSTRSELARNSACQWTKPRRCNPNTQIGLHSLPTAGVVSLPASKTSCWCSGNVDMNPFKGNHIEDGCARGHSMSHSPRRQALGAKQCGPRASHPEVRRSEEHGRGTCGRWTFGPKETDPLFYPCGLV